MRLICFVSQALFFSYILDYIIQHNVTFGLKLNSNDCVGSWFEEASEEVKCAQALDARQTRWCICKFIPQLNCQQYF